jgi:hypothetical protein
MSNQPLPVPVNFEDDLHQLQAFVKLQTDKKLARITDYTLDAELEKAAIAIAQLVAVKAVLHKRHIEGMIHSTDNSLGI